MITRLQFTFIYTLGKGISIQFGEPVKVQCNHVHENKSDGIKVDGPAPVHLANNFVTLNFGAGVKVTNQVTVSTDRQIFNTHYSKKESPVNFSTIEYIVLRV